MTRHPNQTKGIAAITRARPTAAAHNKPTATQDLALLAKATAALPKKPPHCHVWVDGGCRICGALEVESK